MEITWPSQRNGRYEKRFAKWDEAAEPIDHAGAFQQWLVPLAYAQTLVPGRTYEVPIVFESEDGFEIFCGFWFDTSGRYHADRHVKDETPITLHASGADLSWEEGFTARRLAETGGPRLEPHRIK